MHRNKSVDVHQFAMIPKSEIPRSSFRMQKTYKTTFDSGLLVPIFLEEVLPGDTFNLRMTAFARLATPIFPIMDNLYLESFFFFVPNRLVWTNWQRFMGEQQNPGDSISFTIPQIESPVGGYSPLSIYDYLGLPTEGQVDPAGQVTHSALPLRAYRLIYQEWFKDQNLVSIAPAASTGDGPDSESDYTLYRRGKRHDYFTSALPFTQKGTAVPLPLGTSAPVEVTSYANLAFQNPTGTVDRILNFNSGDDLAHWATAPGVTSAVGFTIGQTMGLTVDLSAATAATVNQLRQSFQIQKLLERDARGGTRYTEIIRAHFGVVSPDARLQRPEYLGGGSTPININPVAQTSSTDATTPQGNLAAMGTALMGGHGFTQSFTEHGYIMGIVNVRADLTYQQGMRRHWSRLTRYDYYFPVFAMLGEQAILSKEIYCDGTSDDELVFGYQERWAEYRYNPSEITGLFKSTTATPIDAWHLSQRFMTRPLLNATFINDTPPLDRIIAVGEEANGQQLLLDAFFDAKVARPMPIYSVPGLIDHF